MNGKECFLRKGTAEDMDLLFQWANDPAVRRFSFNSDPIAYENHQRWFKRMMEDDSVLQFILMDGDEPVGQIRLNIEGEYAELGYSVSSECRGHGYGRTLLRLTAQEVKTNYPQIKRLIAAVKSENTASAKILEKENFGIAGTDITEEIYQKDIFNLKKRMGDNSIAIYERII